MEQLSVIVGRCRVAVYATDLNINWVFFFFQAEDGIRDLTVTGVQTCALPIFKFYACVGSNHTTLDALRTMQAEHRFRADDVERITVHGSQVTLDHVGWKYEPAEIGRASCRERV